MSKKRKKKINLIKIGTFAACVLILSSVFLSKTMSTAYAGGYVYDDASGQWMYDENASGDDADYTGGSGHSSYQPVKGFTDPNSSIYATGSGTTTPEDDSAGDDPGWLEKQIIKLLKLPGNILSSLEKNWKMTLDNVIYGRISFAGTNYYQFELVTNNPYGMVGGYMYNIFRIICLMVMWCIFAAQVTKSLVFNSTAKARDEMKSNFSRLLFITVGLYIMPYAIDLLFYVRDVILYLLHNLSGTIAFGGDSSATSINDALTSIFSTMADKSWLWAIIYVGTTFLALYFAYAYIGVAMAMTIYFILFPLVCIASYMDKNVLSNWVKNILAAVLVPVLDGVLLIIPTVMYGAVYSTGQHILAGVLTLIICMMIIPSRKSVGQLLGLNTGGLGAMTGAALGALALAKGVGGMIRGGANAVGHFKNAKEASDEAKMYEDMDKAEKEVGAGFEPVNSNKLEGLPLTENKESESSGGSFAGGTGGSFTGMGGSFAGGAGGSTGSFKGDANLANASIDAFDMPSAKQDVVNQQRVLDRAKDLPSNNEENIAIRDDAIRQAKTQVEGSQDKLAALQDIKSQNMYGAMSADAQLNSRKNEIMERRMNINNYNTPQFAGMSNAKKAELARKRARSEMFKGVGSTAGATLGATYGMAATTFFSPTATVMAMGAGSQLGSVVGSSMGSAANFAMQNTSAGRMINAGAVASGSYARTAATSVGRNISNSSVMGPVHGARQASMHIQNQAQSYAKDMEGAREDIRNGSKAPNSFNGLV